MSLRYSEIRVSLTRTLDADSLIPQLDVLIRTHRSPEYIEERAEADVSSESLNCLPGLSNAPVRPFYHRAPLSRADSLQFNCAQQTQFGSV